MIRPYSPEDKTQLLHLLKLNSPQYFDPSEEADYIHYLDHELEDYFVVEEAGQIIGCGGINYFQDEKTARISWDMLHPDFQGKGIGSRLLQHRIDHIRKNPDYHHIVVRTSQMAFKFYEKGGFRLETVQQDFWAPGFDLYQMRIDLL